MRNMPVSAGEKMVTKLDAYKNYPGHKMHGTVHEVYNDYRHGRSLREPEETFLRLSTRIEISGSTTLEGLEIRRLA